MIQWYKQVWKNSLKKGCWLDSSTTFRKGLAWDEIAPIERISTLLYYEVYSLYILSIYKIIKKIKSFLI